jgi:sterol desaturase/sphingolipid hydroxylase (fatty acid hydroxylase superfamily)
MIVASLAAALASLALLALAFVPLERAFPARAGQRILRPAFAVDLCFFFGQYLVWNGASLALLAVVQRSLDGAAPAGWRALTDGAPTWGRALAAIVLGDVLVYWFHRACHRFDLLWRFHAVHHSARHLDWLAAHREHPLDGIGTQLCANLPAFLIGFPVGSLAGLIAFRGMWAIFVHSNVRLPLGPLRPLLGAPELHHFHHARARRTRHNFANLAPWLDLLFGTHHLPDPGACYPLGIDEPWPTAYLDQLAHPFVQLARRARDELRRAAAQRRERRERVAPLERPRGAASVGAAAAPARASSSRTRVFGAIAR